MTDTTRSEMKISNEAYECLIKLVIEFDELVADAAFLNAEDVGKKVVDIISVYEGAKTVMESSSQWIDEICNDAKKKQADRNLESEKDER